MAENEQESGLAEFFNGFAGQTIKAFPALKDKFVIYSAAEDKLYGDFDPADEADLLKAQRLHVEAFKAQWADSGFGYTAFATRTGDYNAITYLGSDEDALKDKETTKGLLSHELGHLTIPGSFDNMRVGFRECEAEIFSVIQLGQEYKDKAADFVNYALYWKVHRLVMDGESLHFALPALQELKHIPQEELAAMTPEETANFSYRFSLLHAVSDEDLIKLADIFAPCNNKGIERYAECAARMLEDHGALTRTVFQTGKEFLDPILNERKDLMPGWTDESFNALKKGLWIPVRQAIAEISSALDEAENTPERRASREAEQMMAFGRFDRGAGVADLTAYDSDENMDYLQRAMQAYAALRLRQITGEDAPSSRTETTARARNIAERILPPKTPQPTFTP